jgi:hypothetical protein
MKFAAAVVLAVVAVTANAKGVKTNPGSKAPKKNRIVMPLVQSRHSDMWCHTHHNGAGDAACRKHNGCCYSKKVDGFFKKKSVQLKMKEDAKLRKNLSMWGPCSSCDHHDNEWCDFYGSVGTSTCIKLSMCTWNVGKSASCKPAPGTKNPSCASGVGGPKLCAKKSKAGAKCIFTPAEKGTCSSKFRRPANFGKDMFCNVNNGGKDDTSYPKFKKCIAAAMKKDPKCHKTPSNQDPDAPETKPVIKGGQLWFKKKPECLSYKLCAAGRAWNRRALDRCPNGYQFKWQMKGEVNGKKFIGRDALGCRDKYAYKAMCKKTAEMRCLKKKENGKRKLCKVDFDCCGMKKGCKDKCAKTKKMVDSKLYLPYQADEDSIGFDGYFCVDRDGHEIPDTRKTRPVQLFDINCVIQRQKHKGMQCPNAVTLTTHGGGIVVNKRNGKKKSCKVHCNSDTDCPGAGKDKKWCCFNGCGYTCKKPVEPLKQCQQPPMTELREQGAVVIKGEPRGLNKVRLHGMEIEVACGPGYAQPPINGKRARQQLTLECQHGQWVHCKPNGDCIGEAAFSKMLKCMKDCAPFSLASTLKHVKVWSKKANKKVWKWDGAPATVPAARTREHDLYDQARTLRPQDILETKRVGFKTSPGDLNEMRHHGATRTIGCPPGYGAVQHTKFLKGKKKSAKSLFIVRHGYETLTCGAKEAGRWEARHLECSVCYDAYEWQWRDSKGNSCHYYRSRPLKCHDTKDHTYPSGATTAKEAKFCGKWSAEWAQVGYKLMQDKMITKKQFRALYQPWGAIKSWRNHQHFSCAQGSNGAYLRAYNKLSKRVKRANKWGSKFGKGATAKGLSKGCMENSGRNYWKVNGRALKQQGGKRPCQCVPEMQPTFYKGQPTSPPNTCGQMKKGKKVTIDPMTGKEFKGGKFSQGFYFADSVKYGSAVDNCRVSCRSCQKAEARYLQRTRYTKAEFKELVGLNKIKKANVAKQFGGKDSGKGKWKLVKRRVLDWVDHTKVVKRTKTISKSYTIDKVCSNGKGRNFLKCGADVKPDPRPICKSNRIMKNGCLKGFSPMA